MYEIQTLFDRPRLGHLLLRWTLAGLMLMHGIHKVQHGVAGIEGMLHRSGLPSELAVLVYIGEILAPVMLLAGYQVVLAAGILVVNMLFAIGLAHLGQLQELTKTGGWALELQAFYLVGALTVMFTASDFDRRAYTTSLDAPLRP